VKKIENKKNLQKCWGEFGSSRCYFCVNEKEGRGGKENEEEKDEEAAQICSDNDDSGDVSGIPVGGAYTSGCGYERICRY